MSGFSLAAAEVGAELPELLPEQIDRATLAAFAESYGDLNPIHLDPQAARAAGLDDVIAHGMLSMALLGRLLVEWAPVEDVLSFRVSFTAVTTVPARLRCTARIKAIETVAGGRAARLALAVRRVDGPLTVRGRRWCGSRRRRLRERGRRVCGRRVCRLWPRVRPRARARVRRPRSPFRLPPRLRLRALWRADRLRAPPWLCRLGSPFRPRPRSPFRLPPRCRLRAPWRVDRLRVPPRVRRPRSPFRPPPWSPLRLPPRLRFRAPCRPFRVRAPSRPSRPRPPPRGPHEPAARSMDPARCQGGVGGAGPAVLSAVRGWWCDRLP